MAIDRKKGAALSKISDRGYDTEKKIMAIDIDVIDEEDFTKEISEIRGLKKVYIPARRGRRPKNS